MAANGFDNPAFNNRIVGPNGAATRHEEARTILIARADAVLRQALPSSSISVQAFNQIGGAANSNSHPNPDLYELVPIFDPLIVNYLAQIFAFTSAEIARAADFPIRIFGNSPYDAPTTPVIARRSHVNAAALLSQRQSYVKAILIHTRGLFNIIPCQRCKAAYDRDGEFLHYAGCISLPTWWNGACSNCVHDDHGASCSNKLEDNRKLSYDDWTEDMDKGRQHRSRGPPDSPTKKNSRTVRNKGSRSRIQGRAA